MPSPSLAVLPLLLSATAAISLHQPRDAAPRVLQFDLHRNVVADPVAHDRGRLHRRSDTVKVSLENQRAIYGLNVTLGSPGQTVNVDIDTGSSDLWVNTPKSKLCSSSKEPCDEAGSYRANSSSTYTYLDSTFNITYADGSGAAGDYASDTLRIGGQSISDFHFGIGYESSSALNILGIGYAANEALVSNLGRKPYKNLPQRLVSDGTIASAAYSLWLNDQDAQTGNLLFGGVDRAHYTGELVTLPIQPITAGQESVFSEFWVTLSTLQIDSQDTIARDMGLAVLLDSGTSLTYLPDEIASVIFDAVGAEYDQANGVGVVPCSLGRQSANLTFRFDEPAVINVPLNELVLGSGDDGNSPPPPMQEESLDQLCTFGIAPSGDGAAVLGDTFLRSAYVVFDLDNNEVSLAQSKLGAKGSDVVEISKGAQAVPSAEDAEETASATIGLPILSTVVSDDGQGQVGGGSSGDGGDGSGDGNGDTDDAGTLAPGMWYVVVLSAAIGFGGLLL